MGACTLVGMSAPTAEDFRRHVTDRLPVLRERLAEIVAMNSVHGHEPTACAAAAAWTIRAFTAAGVPVEGLPTADGSVTVYGRREAAPGRPTVLLYSHYDVQPSGDPGAWTSGPWDLTERDGRWYGRGAADCKGNLVMHLAVLDALRDLVGPDLGGIGIVVVCEGSEEQGGAGLEALVAERPELFASDAILIADTGNVAVGRPTLNTSLRGVANLRMEVETLRTGIHSGMYGGSAPDALAALIAALATLRDAEGRTTIDGLPTDLPWDGVEYDADRFRADAGVLDGVELSSGGSVAELTWARPAVTVIGLDAPRIAETINAVQPRAAAVLNLRVPPGIDPVDAQEKLIEHLRRRVPWNARVAFTRDAVGYPFRSDVDGPVHRLLSECLAEAFDTETVSSGEGASIPLCNALQQAVPDAQIALFGVEEPLCAIHAPDESVDPSEIVGAAVAEALFLSRYAH